MAVTSFAELYNAGGIYRDLFKDTGPADPEDLDRRAHTCMKVAGDEKEEGRGEGVTRFLRLFKEYREMEKERERDGAVIASRDRYIGALEGRGREQAEEIKRLREALDAAVNPPACSGGAKAGRKEEI
jgi:hypothetical protein